MKRTFLSSAALVLAFVGLARGDGTIQFVNGVLTQGRRIKKFSSQCDILALYF